MPLLDQQRTYLATYHLRIGAKRPDKDGVLRPASLDHFRVTTRAPLVAEAFGVAYDGEVSEWTGDHSGDRWAVDLPSSLEVLIPPGESLTQWYERWDSGGCLARCDSVTETLTRKPCACPADIDRRMTEMRGKAKAWCQPTSRLHVVCPAVATLGIGMLTTHSLVVARSLPGAVELAQMTSDYTKAILSVVRVQGKRQYPLIHLDLVGVAWAELPAVQAAQIAAGARRAELSAGANYDDPPPSTGGREVTPSAAVTSNRSPAPASAPATDSPDPGTGPRCSPSQHRKLMALMGRRDHDSRCQLLTAILSDQGTGERIVHSSNDLTDAEIDIVTEYLRKGGRK